MNSSEAFIHSSCVIDSSTEIGEYSKVWHFSHIMSEVSIGMRCSFGQNTFIGKGVQIGNNVKVQNNVSIYSGVLIEDSVFIGPSVVFTNVINPRSEINRSQEFQPTTIKKGASIGANATIVCGNTIGEYAFIGAGSVITKNIPAFALFVGNPGIQIGWVSKAGHRLQFDHNKAVCPETGETYQLNQNTVYLK